MKINIPTHTSSLMKGTILDLIYKQTHISSFPNQRSAKAKHAYHGIASETMVQLGSKSIPFLYPGVQL